MNNIKVNCYSGHTYAERPMYFQWQGIEYEVAVIKKAWLEPGERRFLIVTADNKLFRLSYNESEKQWSAIKLGG